MQIADKVALVTGGASGLGLASVEVLHAAGARVVVCDLPASKGAEVAERLGERARFAPADVTDTTAMEQAVATATEAFGGLQILVSCAGIGWAQRTVDRLGPHDFAAFETVVRVNLLGTFNAIRLGAAKMVEQEPDGEERGVIVATASIAAFDGQIGQAAYSASKAGVAGMTLPIARDLAARLVRVVTIAPGTFDTPLLALLPDEERRRLGDQTPNPRRLGRPEEFAALVRHVVENPFINGETIRLDGALRMPPR